MYYVFLLRFQNRRNGGGAGEWWHVLPPNICPYIQKGEQKQESVNSVPPPSPPIFWTFRRPWVLTQVRAYLPNRGTPCRVASIQREFKRYERIIFYEIKIRRKSGACLALHYIKLVGNENALLLVQSRFINKPKDMQNNQHVANFFTCIANNKIFETFQSKI